MKPKANDDNNKGAIGPATKKAVPVVSSAHLASGGSQELSEIEFGLILAGHSFSRWMTRCMAAAGVVGLSPVEVMILHTVKHRDRPKKLADICLVLDIEDTHVAAYAIRKLEAAGLVAAKRPGKEKLINATKEGAAVCDRYAEIRERLLVKAMTSSGPRGAALSELAVLLRSLSGYYSQAARAAAAS